MPYEFRKIYIDCVTPGGVVCVVYFTWVRFFQRWHGHAGAEIYWPDGERDLVHASATPSVWDPERGLDQLPVSLPAKGGELRLEISAVQGAWSPKVRSPCPELSWQVLALRCGVDVSFPGPKGARRVHGKGYADYVRLTRATRKLGLRSLRWGRAHLPGHALAFTSLELISGERWRVGVHQADGLPAMSYGKLSSELQAGTGQVRLGTGGRVLLLEAERQLHAGSAFDAERVPNLLHRQVCLAVGGATEERRWKASARLRGARDKEGSALHEIVWFGKHARQAAKGELQG